MNVLWHAPYSVLVYAPAKKSNLQAWIKFDKAKLGITLSGMKIDVTFREPLVLH